MYNTNGTNQGWDQHPEGIYSAGVRSTPWSVRSQGWDQHPGTNQGWDQHPDGTYSAGVESTPWSGQAPSRGGINTLKAQAQQEWGQHLGAREGRALSRCGQPVQGGCSSGKALSTAPGVPPSARKGKGPQEFTAPGAMKHISWRGRPKETC